MKKNTNPPAVDETLDLIGRLGETVRKFSAREEQLTRAYRLSLSTTKEEHEETLRELEEQRASTLSETEALYESRREQTEAKYQNRARRINRAHKAAKQFLLTEIRKQEGGRKYHLQKEVITSSRQQEAELAALTEALQTHRAALAGHAKTLRALETHTRRAFGGYPVYRRKMAQARKDPALEPDLTASEPELVKQLESLIAQAQHELSFFRQRFLPSFFKFLPFSLLFILLVLGHGAVIPLAANFDFPAPSYTTLGISLGASVAALFLIYLTGRARSNAPATSLARLVATARRLHDACATEFETRYQQRSEALVSGHESYVSQLDKEWKQSASEVAKLRESSPKEIDGRLQRALATNERQHHEAAAKIDPEKSSSLAELKAQGEDQLNQAQAARDEKVAQLTSDYETNWAKLEEDWRQEITPLYTAVAEANEQAAACCPAWIPENWKDWSPPRDFAAAARFATFHISVPELANGCPKDERLALPGPADLELPLSLTLPKQGSLLLETGEKGRADAVSTLNNVILRILSLAPPGRVSFTILDPVGLGENFAGVMHLADFEESLIHSRIWTQTGQMEQRLGELNEHMEKVIQMYLRNEYATIAEYNEKAGTIAEKYQFLVVADFPNSFSEVAAKHLLSIATSGARCGVYTLLHWDRRQKSPYDNVGNELKANSVWMKAGQESALLAGEPRQGAKITLDAPPDPALSTELIQKIGKASIDSSRVEVPFSHVIPQNEAYWTEDTTKELNVPIGRTGATKLQYLSIGKGTCQHALIAGKTGSGKSTLFHVIITNLALWCSPDQVDFYLIDFKKGVEFKCYATHHLPHAKVVAIESDREFALSVLQRVDEELKRRGDIFRKLGVQDIAGYKKAGGTEPMPRSLLMIDEFQEYFVEDDRISQNAAVLLDRIVRQGRAFGIHVLLGSQTLGGAYTLARTTFGQMVIRIALQCNEADAYLIMDDNNPAPRLLTRPGEGIYNDAAGALEGNSPFQVVWLGDDERDEYLTKARSLADATGRNYPGPIVFEGNAPAEIRENHVMRQALTARPAEMPGAAHLWLGAPNSIKGPTEAVFHRQSGNNLLIVGQREEAALAIFAAGLVGLSAQYPRDGVKFMVLDGNAPDSPYRDFLDRAIAAVPQTIELYRGNNAADAIVELAAEMKQRAGDDSGASSQVPARFLFVFGLQRFKKLKFEEDFGFSMDDTESSADPGAALNDLITEGPSHGYHLVLALDTYNNLNRFLSRKALSEFEMRVLFQMSANDSASLIDSPKASDLGLNRALFYNEQEGYLETFRPYALPGHDWLEEAGQSLTELHGTEAPVAT